VIFQIHINSGITNTIIPKELIVSHLVKKLCPFYGTQKVNHSQGLITHLYSEQGESVHTITPYFFKSINAILLYMPKILYAFSDLIKLFITVFSEESSPCYYKLCSAQ
jgi:hypothetical protein